MVSTLLVSLVVLHPGWQSTTGDYAADEPQVEWLVRFAEESDRLFPYVVRTRTSVRKPGSQEYLPAYESSFRTDGAVSRSEDLVVRVCNPEEIRLLEVPEKVVLSDDGVETRSVSGWLPEDAIDVPLRPGTSAFDRLLGVIKPTDPSESSRSPASRLGMTLWCGSLARSVSGRRLSVEVIPSTGDGSGSSEDETVVELLGDDSCAGTRMTFLRSPERTVLTRIVEAATRPDAAEIEFSDHRLIDEHWIAFRIARSTPFTEALVVVDEVRFTPPNVDVEPVRFLPGMRVKDTQVGLDKTIIWTKSGPGEIVSADRMRTYGYKPYEPPVPDEAIEGRAEGFGWMFWAVNGVLVAAVAGLLWLRRGAA